MNVAVEQHPAAAVARLDGEIDLANADSVRARVVHAATGHPTGCLVVDLTAVGYIDSAGIEMLFRLRSDLVDEAELMVVAPPGSRAHRLLALVAMGEVGEVFESVDVALQACAAR